MSSFEFKSFAEANFNKKVKDAAKKAVQKHGANIFLYGGMVYKETKTKGFDLLGSMLPKAKRDTILSCVADNLSKFKTTWTIALLVTVKTDSDISDEEDMVSEIITVEGITAAELDKHVSEMHEELYRDVPEEERYSKLWIASPSKLSNMEKMITKLWPEFRALGAWSEEVKEIYKKKVKGEDNGSC